jgi:hypothetical protein
VFTAIRSSRHRALAGAASHRLAALIISVAFMRRSSLEATVDDLEAVLGIMRALRSGHRGNANRLPIYMYTILLAVAKRPEGTTMRELRSELILSHSSVTRACLAMDGEGLVRISRARTDRRRKLVTLTQKGIQVIDDVLTALRGSRR